MSKKSSTYVKCRYCDWKTLRFFKKKDGQSSSPTSAMMRLEWHMQQKHPEELKAIEKELDNLIRSDLEPNGRI